MAPHPSDPYASTATPEAQESATFVENEYRVISISFFLKLSTTTTMTPSSVLFCTSTYNTHGAYTSN